ncbi:MAG: sugar phosphate isomerase/epimerase family protein [Burkholderiales bacterium]
MDTITLAGPLSAKLAAVRRAGFTQIMLSARDIAGHPEGEDAAVAAVRASGLKVTGFQVLRDFEGLSGNLHDYKVDIAQAMLRMCRALGSDLLLVCSSTSTHATGDRDALARDLAKLALLAVPMNVRIAYEALSWGRHVNQYMQSWDIVARAGRANLGLALDSFHILAAGSDIGDFVEIDPARLFLVQLSDFMWRETPSFEERRETARHFRVFPGEGVHSAEVGAMLRAIEDTGYRGDYSFEVFNDDYVQLPLDVVTARAARSVQWLTGRVPRPGSPLMRPVAARAGAR